ncbi:MAG: choice-of-anchor B family protein [Wenzhouxiangella sp.]
MAIPPGHEPAVEPQPTSAWVRVSAVPCVDGLAGDFHCMAVDLLAYVPLDDMGCGNRGNDLWGWTDPVTGTEYALMGCNNGTSFLDLSDPVAPIFIGHLPTHTGNSPWRDIKVHSDHAYIVSEASGHGLQVFDLNQLRAVTSPPVQFQSTAHLATFNMAHNIAINEESGFAYVVGADDCGGGLYMVDINDPVVPLFAGCFRADGYTHDTQCVIYRGPDTRYQGAEICFNANPDTNSPDNTLTIVEVTDKKSPQILGRQGYAGSGFAHQGWLTEDHRYFLLGDELDERGFAHNTRTIIWDVGNLEAPVVIGHFFSTEEAIDHNLYVRGNHVYQANYTAGLRILDLTNIATAELVEVAFFDVFPDPDAHSANLQADAGIQHDEEGLEFSGAWSNYPFFDSGIVIVSSIGSAGEPGGLFVLQPHITAEDPGLIFHDRFEAE